MSLTFGETVRAARLGYRWATNIGRSGCWLRVSILGPGRYCLQLCAPGHLRPRRTDTEEHVVWWERPEGSPGLVDLSPALQELADQEITGYLQLILDDTGRRVR
ncbi:MAG TPA: hypothetical protein VFU47_08660 [Armatimonadota bacterium]|nr:hypothetical protein [Armatimonadota bacterium]